MKKRIYTKIMIMMLLALLYTTGSYSMNAKQYATTKRAYLALEDAYNATENLTHQTILAGELAVKRMAIRTYEKENDLAETVSRVNIDFHKLYKKLHLTR